jgi:hypothetical protein
MARVASDPPCDLEEWIAASRARSDAELFPRLRRALPGVTDFELRFRVEAAAGIMYYLITGKMRVDLQGKSAGELERLVVPVIAGALNAPASKKTMKTSRRDSAERPRRSARARGQAR